MSFYIGKPPRRKPQPHREPKLWLTPEFKALKSAIPNLKPFEATEEGAVIRIPADEAEKRGLPDLKAWKLAVRKWINENISEPNHYSVKSYVAVDDLWTVLVALEPPLVKSKKSKR